MAVNQYVGARYIAHGWTEWNNKTPYDALYVVKHNLAWWTASQPVPVGVEPGSDNNQYWQMTTWGAGWEEAVEDLQGDIENLQANINEEVTARESDVKNLQTNINENVNNIQGVANKVKPKRGILIGDSWGEGLFAQGQGWITFLKNYMPETTFYSSAYGGAGFCATGTGTTDNSFLDLLTRLSTNVPNKNTIDIIVVAGGVNDKSFSTTQLTSNISAFKKYVRTNYPNATLYIIACNNYCADIYTASNYITAYLAACDSNTICVDNTRNISGALFYDDMLHCTASGYAKCAQMIHQIINHVPVSSGYYTNQVVWSYGDFNYTINEFFRNGMIYRFAPELIITDTIAGTTFQNLKLTRKSGYPNGMFATTGDIQIVYTTEDGATSCNGRISLESRDTLSIVFITNTTKPITKLAFEAVNWLQYRA